MECGTQRFRGPIGRFESNYGKGARVRVLQPGAGVRVLGRRALRILRVLQYSEERTVPQWFRHDDHDYFTLVDVMTIHAVIGCCK